MKAAQHIPPDRCFSRARIIIFGAVQGVGFRPFVYRLAMRAGLSGWVSNTPQGVIVEVEGLDAAVATFVRALPDEAPPMARIHSIEHTILDPAGYAGFEIRKSLETGPHSAVVLPDIATCSDCLNELFDPNDRRYIYPFINCTNCGPRFTIIDALPYDRPNTSMQAFRQCPVCLSEYHDPSDRRFHAQPNACPVCGPSVVLCDRHGNTVAEQQDALAALAEHLRCGSIAAVKGLGGFHLMCDASRPDVVQTLRSRKRRDEKPFAIMVPSLEHARRVAMLLPDEERVLSSPASPIVLVRRRREIRSFDEAVTPENPTIGLMLPYTPLHHILLRTLDIPLIATSGNLSDEPICTDEREALVRLGAIADVFLIHNRPIRRHADDSVVHIVAGREQVLRRARGYAPMPIITKQELRPILAVGAHLKNTISVSSGNSIILSQHIGDLETAESLRAFHSVVADLPRLHDVIPGTIACDIHPDYLSTQFAVSRTLPAVGVQHHAAHVYSCIADNQLDEPVLGVSWDGTGLGTDGTVWGGEFLLAHPASWKRVGWLRQFSLPGGDASVREPRRTALGLIYELTSGDVKQYADLPTLQSFTSGELRALVQMLERTVNTPRTSSTGRLFDAVASILGVRQIVRHEGQAAMQLEWLASDSTASHQYPVSLDATHDGLMVDWGSMVQHIIDDVRAGRPAGDIAREFHISLAAAICDVAEAVGVPQVVLSGGCFQNALLTELAMERLRHAGFRVYIHQRVPPNDGGISVGQAYAASIQVKTAGRKKIVEEVA